MGNVCKLGINDNDTEISTGTGVYNFKKSVINNK